MEVILAVTKTCHHCPVLERELKRLKVPYCVRYFEDHPKMMEQYGLRTSPVLVVDGRVVFNGMPSLIELERYFKEKTPTPGEE
ncbi:MAG: thioredoxin family protein [Desulfobulbaceae bacterium]|nr:thioredoxin family protein [Desulfobulbaceae bacterium]